VHLNDADHHADHTLSFTHVRKSEYFFTFRNSIANESNAVLWIRNVLEAKHLLIKIASPEIP
jgi:hypothetical protein